MFYESARKVLTRVKRGALALRHDPEKAKLVLSGPYETFADATRASTGYDSPVILNKVHRAVLDVLEQKAAYERDGTSFQVAPVRLKTRDLLNKYLLPTDHVLDFGGGLGGTFINHRILFKPENKYTVVEQEEFVKLGRMLASHYKLNINFAKSIEAVSGEVHIAILSSVLTYIENPSIILRKIAALKPKFIIIDRTAISWNRQSQWWVQEEREYYGEAVSYPFKPVSKGEIKNILKSYNIVDAWKNDFDAHSPPHKGILFKRSS